MHLGLWVTFVRDVIKFCSLSAALYAEWGKAVEDGFLEGQFKGLGRTAMQTGASAAALTFGSVRT